MHYNKLSEILRAKNTEKVVKSCGREESMFPVYEEKKKNLHIHLRTSAHASPHLHNSIEFIYITEGTLELGMGQELFHMEEGDFAVIFPDVIHHYQVFSPGENRAVYLWAKPALTGCSVCGYSPEQLPGRSGHKKGAGSPGYRQCSAMSPGQPERRGKKPCGGAGLRTDPSGKKYFLLPYDGKEQCGE